ncbi:uncharacterized protein Tco025E_08230 [Trypanosoma conorhini]|uniref:RING-type domain-containing protein n=1 Tax=Trypanosoma conorhini TaxID=83891 RepID=A0A3R7KXA2_9TRYP|nr:uncharacterized protein Tco025E_08230 [Trypanosoma conorhini]RNF03196.1 hypothetical protein Tco025E_08230 [Trypanosoma conorhini]
MEFRDAASGNTAALREWLRQHPERVNVPSSGSQYTLLSTAVKCGHLETVQMLVGEFNADLGIPCGGMGNTCVHTAASNCSPELLSYLLSRHPPLKPNAFMEYPRDLAEAATADRASKEECLAMLRAYEEAAGQSLPRRLPPRPPQSSTPVSVPTPSSVRDAIRALKVDSDGDCEASPRTSWPRSTLAGSEVSGMSGMVKARRDGSRNTRNLGARSSLPLDLQAFRRLYGNGFDFTESTHAYIIRGLLPYTYKGSVYDTPVIIILCKPTAAAGSQQGSHSGRAAGRPLPPPLLPPPPPAARYRALIDRKRLGGLFFNRRATYIDPATAAIIPSEADALYHNLLDFLRCAVLDNFERIPPLLSSSNEEKIVPEGLPLFRLRSKRREVTLRILRDLSLFCDGALTYDSATLRVEGFLPLFILTSFPSRGVAATAASAPHLDSHSTRASRNGPEDAALPAELIMRLPLRAQFEADSSFEDPPRVYLTNATTNTPETRRNYRFLSQIIIDSGSGEVHRCMLSTLRSWRQHGSLLAVLTELQQTATLLLTEYCRASPLSRVRGGGGEVAVARKVEPFSAGASATPMQRQALFVDPVELERDTGFLLVGRPVTGAARSATSDDNNNSNADAWVLVSHADDTDLTGRCVICAEAERNVVLLPCRHLVLCSACSLRYKDRLADAMLCPVCRTPIETTLEVFL